MANILTGLIPVIYKAMDSIARERVGFIPTVQLDAQASTAAMGQTVTSHVVPAVSLADIVPGVTPPATGAQTLGTVNLTLSRQKTASFLWTGEEQKAVSNQLSSITENQFKQAFRSLGNLMEADIAAAAIAGSSRATGTAGTTPFGTANVLTDASNLEQILSDNGAPDSDRSLVVSTATFNNLLGKQTNLTKVNEAGTNDALRRALIDNLFGFSVDKSAALKSARAASTGASYVVNGATAAGATSITLKTGTGTINAGDVISFAGDSNQYVVGAGVSAPGTLTINNPGLVNAVADGTAVTVVSAYRPNIAYHKNAIVLAARAPAMPVGGDSASDVTYVTDPYTGLTYQVAVYGMYRQVHIEVGLVWGVQVIKQEFIATLLG
jgi:hypothetical protein